MIDKLEKTLKALGDKNRLRIVNMLASKAMCVCEITQVIGLSQSTVSGHLKVLKEAGLVEDEKNGLWVEYRLEKKDSLISGILGLLLIAMEPDKNLIEERTSASQAQREVICKK